MNEFIIEVKYCFDNSIQNNILKDLQNMYSGWKNIIILNRYSSEYTIKNSDVELLLIESNINTNNIVLDKFHVLYNQNKHGYSEKDSEDIVFNFVKESIYKLDSNKYIIQHFYI